MKKQLLLTNLFIFGLSLSFAQTAYMVRDIVPGSGSPSPTNLTGSNGLIFFDAYESSTNGDELWKSDGTTAGTVLVKGAEINRHNLPEGIYFYKIKNKREILATGKLVVQ